MSYGDTLAKFRNACGYSQVQVAEHISRFSKKKYVPAMVYHWEKGHSLPPVEQFLLMCELYGVIDIQGTFRGVPTIWDNVSKLNRLGNGRIEEYIAMLAENPLFLEQENISEYENDSVRMFRRYIKLYDVPVAAGSGSFLDSDSCVDLEVDDTVPNEADFAVKVRGDSMEPRFVDGQIAFIRKQEILEVGEIGIFDLNDDAYIKRFGNGELISLNPAYLPIRIQEYDAFHIFGKVVG